jgi:hypothetical protein
VSSRIVQLALCTLLAVTSDYVVAREHDPAFNKPRMLDPQDLPIEIDQVDLQRQFDALTSMDLAELEYWPLGPVKSLRGKTGIVLPAGLSERKEGDSADDILALLKAILLAVGTESLNVGPGSRTLRGQVQRFTQSIHDLPVFNSFLGLEYDERSNEIQRIAARFLPDRGLPKKATVTSEWAEKRAFEIVSTMKLGCMPGSITIVRGPELGYYLDPAGKDRPRLAWFMHVQPDSEDVFIDANTGQLLRRVPLSIPFVPCSINPTR